MFGQKKKLLTQIQSLQAENSSLKNSLTEKANELSKLSNEIDSLKTKYEKETDSLKAQHEKEMKDFHIQSKHELSSLAKKRTTTSLEYERNERYYVLLCRSGKSAEYTLSADISIHTTMYMTQHNNELDFQKEYQTIVFLNRIYWNNGGYISFENSLPRLFFNSPVSVVSDDDKTYTVTLTEDKVQYTKAELNEFKSKAFWLQKLKKDTVNDINSIISENTDRFPYFSSLFEDYKYHLNLRFSNELLSKKNPAKKSAEKIKNLSKELRNLGKKYKLLSYQMNLYESVFPWITDFKEVSIDEIHQIQEISKKNDNEESFLSEYISHKEYNELPQNERYQLALDRYNNKPKSKWQIGIAFERYIGFIYEQQGYHVTYFGARKGLEDLGRDLIAKKDGETLIIQCKYWKEYRTVHEKHIFQLFGSMFAYDTEKHPIVQTSLIDYRFFVSKIKGVFVTTCPLSDTARTIASRLNIEVFENFTFDKDYPCIKCNISKTGEKIYHLPFDQQYDRICIDYSKGEFYAHTVQEATEQGFRRAFRHNPNSK